MPVENPAYVSAGFDPLGRTALMEWTREGVQLRSLLEKNDPHIQEILSSHLTVASIPSSVTSADGVEMRNIALQQGMLSLRDHGLALALEGMTTLEEVLRITTARGGEGQP